MQASKKNSLFLRREIDWFNRVLEVRISLYFEQGGEYDNIHDVSPPDLSGDDSEYALLLKEYAMGFDERLVFILAMLPHVQPQALDALFIRNKNLDRTYSEFGGWKGRSHGGFLPTAETAAFILAGSDLVKRFEVIALFEEDHFFFRTGMLRLDRQGHDEPLFSAALLLSSDYLSRCTTGICHKPDYSIKFPAKRISSKLGWHDLVLAPQVLAEVENIKTWIKRSHTIMTEWGLDKSIKPGYRSLFY
ncbi:MAG TPA: ATP-binding protein, partial [Candidatus Tenderia electrophaga]|nr:ATP-binding protein [Candidatus Tenderia electrophaga]